MSIAERKRRQGPNAPPRGKDGKAMTMADIFAVSEEKRRELVEQAGRDLARGDPSTALMVLAECLRQLAGQVAALDAVCAGLRTAPGPAPRPQVKHRAPAGCRRESDDARPQPGRGGAA